MVEAGQVEVKLAELMGHLSVHFSRREPVVQAGKYVRGLLSDLPRKNCWTLAEYAGDNSPARMQWLLERASWDTLAAMGTVRDFAAGHLAKGNGLAIVVLDESGAEKTRCIGYVSPSVRSIRVCRTGADRRWAGLGCGGAPDRPGSRRVVPARSI